ncbi:MAG: hypothetical protein KAJ19_16235, partial [Gammaproteobacteria bacterium]|nr:hypothetical protein [Gammaproteobacteria bacterium]
MTREVRVWIDLFAHTHRVKSDGWTGAVNVERVALPAAGGIADQPARTLQALDVLEQTTVTIIKEQIRCGRKRSNN